MKRSISIEVCLLACCFLSLAVQAQLGVSALGRSAPVGKSTAGRPASIAQSTTPACPLPGVCGSSGCAIYRFIGSGSWDDPANWMYQQKPPEVLPGCYEIHIAPSDNSAVLVFPQFILATGKLVVEAGKKIVIPGNVIIQ